jgi:predicted HAD superfamily Cof-like phosphohydrolase
MGVLAEVSRMAQTVLSLARVAHKLAGDNGGSVTALRVHLMLEELGEVLQAIGEDNLVAVLHELVDKNYVDDGTVLAFGLSGVYNEAFRRVHQANMSKLEDGKPVMDASGRIVKGRFFQPAYLDDLAEVPSQKDSK